MTKEQAEQINPLVLAFIGDSVHTLYLRTKLAHISSSKAGELHKIVTSQINATHQSKAAMDILEHLTEVEHEIYRRGRNSKSNSSAKNASIIDYKKASGYEAVIGFLYITGQYERLEYILTRSEDV